MESLHLGKNSDLRKSSSEHAAGDVGDDSSSNSSLKSFLYAIPSKDTEKQYLNRLQRYFDYLEIPGNNLEEQATNFLAYATRDNKWAYDCAFQYFSHEKSRVERNEIKGGTVNVARAAIKLFYEMNEIDIGWKRIDKGMLPGSTVADDRAPFPEEIRKLIEYQDRRVKVIVLIMISSGIRIGAWNHLRWKHITPFIHPKPPTSHSSKNGNSEG